MVAEQAALASPAAERRSETERAEIIVVQRLCAESFLPHSHFIPEENAE